ncbi:nicotinate-nucleotide pyrophosphorylase [Caerostris extrusa]|uniref:Nicotinate-nucleotide pyrophosphorylase [carboxylating] n=1 Tax=Caerostris extrusa TaxID=172846 RepID=A0AAV4U1V8_CAEEX|nr:nicotinate-nucleotide pyrophosphorylase [Caerostris extrusa]
MIGGVDTHRYDLSSMVMLKDNHIALSGSIEEAIKKARQLCGFSLKIEVECRTLKEALQACQANCDVVMLDNFDAEACKYAAALSVKLQYPNVLVEVSGGITSENMQSYFCPWTDIVSSSTLVQGYPTVDFSMKVTPTRDFERLHALDDLLKEVL